MNSIKFSTNSQIFLDNLITHNEHVSTHRFYYCTIKSKNEWGCCCSQLKHFFLISVSSISTSVAFQTLFYSTSFFLIDNLRAPEFLNCESCFRVVIPRSEANYLHTACDIRKGLFRPLGFKAVRQTCGSDSGWSAAEGRRSPNMPFRWTALTSGGKLTAQRRAAAAGLTVWPETAEVPSTATSQSEFC